VAQQLKRSASTRNMRGAIPSAASFRSSAARSASSKRLVSVANSLTLVILKTCERLASAACRSDRRERRKNFSGRCDIWVTLLRCFRVGRPLHRLRPGRVLPRADSCL